MNCVPPWVIAALALANLIALWALIRKLRRECAPALETFEEIVYYRYVRRSRAGTAVEVVPLIPVDQTPSVPLLESAPCKTSSPMPLLSPPNTAPKRLR